MELTLDGQALWPKSPLPRRMDLPSSRAAFLNLGIIDIWGKIILCRGVLVSMRHTWWAAWLAWSKLLLQGPRFKNFRCVCTCVLSSRFFWINLHPHIVISFSVFPPLSCSSCSPDRCSPSIIGESEVDVLRLPATYHPSFRHSQASFPKPVALLQRDRGIVLSFWLCVKAASEWSGSDSQISIHTGGKNFGKHPLLGHEAVRRGCRLPIRGTSFPVGEWTQQGLQSNRQLHQWAVGLWTSLLSALGPFRPCRIIGLGSITTLWSVFCESWPWKVLCGEKRFCGPIGLGNTMSWRFTMCISIWDRGFLKFSEPRYPCDSNVTSPETFPDHPNRRSLSPPILYPASFFFTALPVFLTL